MTINNLIKKIFVFSILPLLLFSCNFFTGDEVGRLKINQLSTEDNLIISETSIDFEKGDQVKIWTDMDLEYDGNIELRHFLEIYLEDEKIKEIEIDPFDKNVTIKESKMSINGNTKWSFSGKSQEITFDKNGKYTFKAFLMAGINDDIIIKQADLVFKQ